MKFAILLGLTALSLPFAGSALAAGPDMFASLGAGGFSEKIEDFGTNGSLVNARGTIEYNFTPMLGAQGDVVVENLGFGDEEENLLDADLALHGFYRDPTRFLLGGFAQIGHDTESGDSFDDVTRDRRYLGLEAQGFFDEVTVYGQAGWMDVSIDEFDNDSASGMFATGEVRYYPQPNVKLDLHAALSSLTADLFDDTTTTNASVGVGAEYRFDGSPLSIFAKLDRTTSDADDDFTPTLTQQRILVGIKGNMGGDSLFDRDRNGASLNPVLPDVAQFQIASPR